MKRRDIIEKRLKAHTIILIFSYIVSAMLIFTTIHYNKQAKEGALDNARIRIITMSRIFDENVGKSLKIANQILAQTIERYKQSSGAFDLQSYSEEGLSIFSDMFTLLSIIDENGNTKLFSDSLAININVSDRQYFTFHKNSSSKSMFIGYPSLGRATGKWFIPMSLRIDKDDGSFGGVALLSFRPEFFVESFEQMVYGRIFLINEQGIIIACWADNNSNEIGKDYSSCEVFPMSKTVLQGLSISPSIFDQKVRIRAFKKNPKYNTTVVVTISKEEAYQDTQRFLNIYNRYMAMLIFVILFFSNWLFKVLKKRHKASLLLAESELKANSILNSMSEGVLIFQDYNIVYYNPKAKKILKCVNNEMSHMSFFDFTLKGDKVNEKNKYDSLVTNNKNFFQKEYYIKCIDNSKLWIESDFTLVQWQGKPAIQICFNDITDRKKWEEKELQHTREVEASNESLAKEVQERKQLEKERVAMIKELESKNEELKRFVYTVSHDLRSPLISIKGYSNFVKQDIIDKKYEKATEDLEKVIFSADKMSALIDDLLEVSRAGRPVSDLAIIDMKDIVREVIKIMQINLSNKNAEVSFDENMPNVYGDERRIKQLYQNILENAIKYSKPDQAPLINIGYNDSLQAFFVKDNGIGIKKELGNRVFDVFQKMSPMSEGSGIGLSIVKRIIESHKGKIWYESSDNGTTFYFTLNLDTSAQNV
ncbi:MAG: PAS domain-containing protein [Candidatus Cloacimonetes bacterium]|nr:PAS domain-containing protein [Candidatus Cloacimonadota bacterium]MDD2650918.1 ATP-binding protein [Candidatus Cloacimonadota bacterium]